MAATFELPETTKEKIAKYGILGISGIAGLFLLKWLLPIVNTVLGDMVLGFQLLIKMGLLAAVLYAMVTVGPRVLRILAKRFAIKFLRLMPVEHMEIIYDQQVASAERVKDVHRLISGRKTAYEQKIGEYTRRMEKAENLCAQARKDRNEAAVRSQAGIANDLKTAIDGFKIQFERLTKLEAMLKKAVQIAMALIQQLANRKDIAADQWADAQENAKANSALANLFGKNSRQMQVFTDAEQYIQDQCAGTFGELNAIFDQAADIVGQFDLEQGAASTEALERWENRVLALENKAPAMLETSVVMPDVVPASAGNAASGFIRRRSMGRDRETE